MGYDETVAGRVREALGTRLPLVERKMFGGVAFMLDGNMCCGVLDEDLLLRLGSEGAAAALRAPHTKPMDFTGKTMKSMIFVSPAGYASDKDLKSWIRRAVGFARTLPPK